MHDLRGRRCREFRPGLHQIAAPVEQVRSKISGLDFVTDRVRKCSFDDAVREIGFLFRPVAERTAEAVRREVALHPSQNHVERRV